MQADRKPMPPPPRSPRRSLGELFDPRLPEQIEDPYPLYARARREEPVFYCPRLDLWIVTRYADIVAVLKDTARFSSANALYATAEPLPEVRAILREGYESFTSLVQSDPPDHTRVRAVFGKAFGPQRVAALEGQIRAIARELIDAFARDGRADLVSQLALPLPGYVICDLLGVPRADMRQLRAWHEDKQILMSAHAPVEVQVASARGYVAMQRYFQAQIEARRDDPREDLLTLLVPEAIGGSAPLGMQEAVCNAMDLLAAGHDTTTDLIGNAVDLLLARPEVAQALRDDRSLLAGAVDEVLRYESPIRGFFRNVTADAEVAGVRIPGGARVFLLYASGNRDEAEFPDGDRFDIRRGDVTRHLAFGKGIHFCVGSLLARTEGRTAIDLLLGRLPGLRRGEGVARRKGFFFQRGYDVFPIAWDVPPDA
ncbi:cytochrome P450 [Sorangium cellulosum]|uniref:Cytochrome P450 n=1 Tax=Sorangium cellulosum TaxID=56 RepID=A0A4P2QDM6_SORCE|nr:cytochrome P450 [Sorangium cellulosum]AUX27508.1 cytochrome P450 [Sorangium cellulosum]